MANLGTHANNILALFGHLPECMLSMEEAANAFLRTRKFYWQQIGTSAQDMRVRRILLDTTAHEREFELPGGIESDAFPAFAEIEVAIESGGERAPVDIVPREALLRREGERALSVFDFPIRARLAWDAWDDGDVYLFYDPSARLEGDLDTEIVFPYEYLEMIEQKSAYDLAALAMVKEQQESFNMDRPANEGLIRGLGALSQTFAANIQRWEREWLTSRLKSKWQSR